MIIMGLKIIQFLHKIRESTVRLVKFKTLNQDQDAYLANNNLNLKEQARHESTKSTPNLPNEFRISKTLEPRQKPVTKSLLDFKTIGTQQIDNLSHSLQGSGDFVVLPNGNWKLNSIYYSCKCNFSYNSLEYWIYCSILSRFWHCGPNIFRFYVLLSCVQSTKYIVHSSFDLSWQVTVWMWVCIGIGILCMHIAVPIPHSQTS